MGRLISLLFFVIASATSAVAADEPNANFGRELFESPKLGTNGKCCINCHQGGRNIEWAATFEDEKLARIVNACIQKTMKGKPLATDSREMQSMLSYIKTFAGPR